MRGAELIDGPPPPTVSTPSPATRFERLRLSDLAAASTIVLIRLALRLAVVLGLAACLAWPWIDQDFYWLGWLGIGGFLFFRRYVVGMAAVLWTLLYCTAALGIAFHWAPAAMAYTINGNLPLGTLVMLPILLFEAARLALPFLLVGGVPRTGDWLILRSPRSKMCLSPSPLPSPLRVPQWVWLAVVAVALETIVPAVFPWRLGYLQVGAPIMNQFASVAGPAIATFSVFALAALVCGTLAAVCWALGRGGPPSAARLERRELWTAAAFTGANLLWGGWMFYTWENRLENAEVRQVALVQVDPSYTDSLDKMRRFTRQFGAGVDLVCWPESSIGCYSVQLDGFADRKRLRQNSRLPLRGVAPMESPSSEILAGGKSYEGRSRGDDNERVSAYLIDRQEKILGRYDKTRLMPFGEYVPGAEIIPGLTTLFGFGDNPSLTGDEPRALTASWGGRIGAMMCYEDLMPGVSRALARDGAEVLIVLINGVAFESPHALLQHRQLAVFRAVENRRYLLRTASTGSTSVIDPLGRVVAELPVQTEGVLKAEVRMLAGQTVYTRLGDVLGWTCVVLSGVFLIQRVAASRVRGRWSSQA